MGFALLLFADSFLVPFSRNVDPGRSGDGMLFLILGFRAASKNELPSAVVIGGGCLAMLTMALNHEVLRSPSVIWTPIAVALLLFVLLWGRKRSNGSSSER